MLAAGLSMIPHGIGYAQDPTASENQQSTAAGVGRSIDETYKQPSDSGFWGEIFDRVFSDHKGQFEKSVAVVVALGDYSGDFTTLEAPYHDAIRMTNFLTKKAQFDHVITLTNEKATLPRIAEVMEEVIPSLVGENDRFLFYFSGHGTERKLPNRIRGYLPMLESKKTQWSSMISMDQIRLWHANVSHARHALFLLDSCFSGLAGTESKGDSDPRYVEELVKPAHHILTAGAAGQVSYASISEWGGSLFTDAFLDGVEGAADAAVEGFGTDGLISLSELRHYIRKKLSQEKQKHPEIDQSPGMSILDGKNDGEFFFLSRAGRASGESKDDLIARVNAQIAVIREREIFRLADEHLQQMTLIAGFLEARLAGGGGSPADVSLGRESVVSARIELGNAQLNLRLSNLEYEEQWGEKPEDLYMPDIAEGGLPENRADLARSGKSYETLQAWDRWQGWKVKVKGFQSQVEDLFDQRDRSQMRFANGMVTLLDVLEMESRLASMRVDLIAAETAEKRALAALLETLDRGDIVLALDLGIVQ